MSKAQIMRLLFHSIAVLLVLVAVPAARSQSSEDSGKGLIWYEDVIGSASSLGTVTRFDSTLGYNFNHHFALDFGAPVLFVQASSSTTSSTPYRSATGIGDVYTDLRFTFRTPVVNYIPRFAAPLPRAARKTASRLVALPSIGTITLTAPLGA